MNPIHRWFKRFRSRVRTTGALFNGELLVGSVTLEAKHYRDGKLLRDYGVVSRKKVTGAFVTFIVANMVTDTTEIGDFKYHASGTGTNAEANTDTAMQTDSGVARASGTQVAGGTATAPTYQSVATMAYVSSLAITEHGLFSKVTSTTLCDRSVFSAINVVSGDSIQFTYTLTLNAEA